jgi:hypothetical protein
MSFIIVGCLRYARNTRALGTIVIFLSGDLFRDQIDSAALLLLSSSLREITTRKDDIDIFPLPISRSRWCDQFPIPPRISSHGRGFPPSTRSGTHTSPIRSPPPLSFRDLRVAPIRMRRYTSSHSRSTTGSTFLAQSRGRTFGYRCYRRGRILPFPSINRRRAIRVSEGILHNNTTPTL